MSGFLGTLLRFIGFTPEMLVLTLTMSGLLIMVGAFFPRARDLAGSMILFALSYPILGAIFEELVEVIPDELSLPLLVVALLIPALNVLCETFMFLGFARREKEKRRCLRRIIGWIVRLPLRLTWGLVRSLFHA